MSAQETEAPAAPAAAAGSSKKILILVSAALFFSLISVVLLVVLLLRPVASKIEEGNTEIKEAMESGHKDVGKKIEALRDACIDWQAVLKTASDKPDAIFKIEKSADGLLLSLTEIKGGLPAPAAEEQKNH